MSAWTLDINETSISPAKQVERILIEDLHWITNNLMPIVVPIKDVGVEFVKNAIYGIPVDCPIIFVSATTDEYVRAQERSIVKQYHGSEDRDILWIPQSGSPLKSFLESEYADLVKDNEVITGYREALLIGSFAVKSLGADYFGVIDGDNWSPMSIREFVTLYARGFRNGAEYVSVEWRCKPKCSEEGFEWKGAGRVSQRANGILNQLVEHEGVITSSCSGDHAITMELWDQIEHTENHSGEVNAFVKMIEGRPSATVMQYKTMSPMFHQYGDGEHIEQELSEVMRPIYHSRLSGEEIRSQIDSIVDVESSNRSYGLTDKVGNNFLDKIDV